MESGGNLLRCDRLLNTIDKPETGVDEWQQLRRIQAPEGLLRDLQQFPDQGDRRLDALVVRARRRPQPSPLAVPTSPGPAAS